MLQSSPLYVKKGFYFINPFKHIRSSFILYKILYCIVHESDILGKQIFYRRLYQKKKSYQLRFQNFSTASASDTVAISKISIRTPSLNTQRHLSTPDCAWSLPPADLKAAKSAVGLSAYHI